jgi:phage protein D
MTETVAVTSHISIKVGDTELPDAWYRNLIEVAVDQHVHLPGMFSIRLHDPDLRLLDNGPFDLTKTVEIASRNAQGKRTVLIQGEITALAPEFGEGMVAELVVSGYDRLHRLYREIKSRTYINVKDSDLAKQIAQAAGLTAEVDPTTTVYEHLYQHNQSDLDFLRQRAWRIGYECFVEEGKLRFRKPTTNTPQVTLTWGQDLHIFRPRMTVAEQVEEVIIKGWDVQNKTAITGKATKGQLYPQIKERNDGAKWAGELGPGSKLVIVDQPVVSQAEANILAAARLNEISGIFVEAEGEAFRRPEIKAGQLVQLEGLGKRLSGAYLVTSATHIYTHTGFKTNFSVRGARTGLISDILAEHQRLDRWVGVVPAVVTNTDDPNQWGRVKVKFPWMTEEQESAWARVIGAGAGPKAGLCALPAVDDEVLVTFVHGDFDCPVVLGGVWNGRDALPGQVADAPATEKPQVRTWHTPKGHRLTTYDNADNKMEIVTAAGHHVALNDAQKKIEVVSQGGHNLTLDDQGRKITLTSQGGLSVTLDDNATAITINSATNATIQAGATLTLQAATLSLLATTLSLSASGLTMKGDGNIEMSTSGQVAIKGSTIALNPP